MNIYFLLIVYKLEFLYLEKNILGVIYYLFFDCVFEICFFDILDICFLVLVLLIYVNFRFFLL